MGCSILSAGCRMSGHAANPSIPGSHNLHKVQIRYTMSRLLIFIDTIEFTLFNAYHFGVDQMCACHIGGELAAKQD